jgi:hypothetical protein
MTDRELLSLAKQAGLPIGKVFAGSDLVECLTTEQESFARAIEAEVRKQYDALIRQMLEAMENVDVNAVGKAADEYDAAVGAARARLKS